MKVKLVIKFNNEKRNTVYITNLKSFKVEGCSLELWVDTSSDDEIVTAYHMRVYKHQITGVEVNYDE